MTATAPRPVVLLHGFTGSPASWDPVVDTLASPVLAPAALGHDGSPGPEDVVTFEDEVDRLAAAVRTQWDPPVESAQSARPRSRPHLAGYSMGGRLALGLLVRHGDLFGSATLIGASPGLASDAEREARAESDETWARLLDEEGLDTFVARWEALPLFASQASITDAATDAQRRIRRSHDARGLARSLRTVGLAGMPDYRARLRDVTMPVRLVVGERDTRFRGLAEEMAARLPRARVTVVPGAGHNVVLEKPAAIAELLREDRNP